MNTLNLLEAAKLLNIHPTTLQAKAKSGVIPGAKIGKSWVFIEIDLLDHIRAQYSPQVAQGDNVKEKICHSTSVKIRPYFGSKFRSADEQAS